MDDTPISRALKSGASPAIDMSPGINSDFPGFNGGLVKLSPLPVTEDYNLLTTMMVCMNLLVRKLMPYLR